MSVFANRAEVLDALDAHVRFLQASDREDTLFLVPRFVAFLKQPLLHPLCDALVAEERALHDAYQAHLTNTRTKALELACSGAELPSNEAVAVRALATDFPEPSDAGMIAELLKRLEVSTQRLLRESFESTLKVRAQELARSAGALRVEHELRSRCRSTQERTSAARALESLKAVAKAFAPTDADGLGAFTAIDPTLRVDDPRYEYQIQRSKKDAALVGHELRLRADSLYSRRAVVARYVARAQTYDAANLRAIAGNNRGQVEQALTLDFARYLFDQGLNPLVDVKMGRLRPDVIEQGGPWTFYVEAKQYTDSQPLQEYLSQVFSTWTRIRHDHDVHEAFLMVFRRAGPLYELPEVLRYHGLTIHIFLVDIAENDESGSRAKPPIVVTEAQLLARK